MVKKFLFLISFLALGLFIASNVFALNAPPAGGGNPEKWYIEAEWNDSTHDGEHGMCVEWDLDSDSNETFGYTIKRADTADAENIAGVIPSGDDTAHSLRSLVEDGTRLEIQIKGYHQDLPTDGTVTEGQSIENDASGYATDGDGLGFAFETDSADTGSSTGTSADCWIDFDKGTN